MIPPKDRQSPGPQMSHFSPLVLCQMVLLLLAHFSDGQPQPTVAMVGDEVILPCHLGPAKDAVSMTVEWARADLKPRFVHLRREGVELLIEQNPSYIGRTSLSINKLKCGDLSLQLSRVKLSDEGTYTCLTASQETQNTRAMVKLVVGSVSSPVLRFSRLSSESTAVVLDCESKGWYPEPEVSWLDSKGNVLSAGPTETVRGPDGLYTVSSRVTVEKRHSSSVTCRVQQEDINQSREMQIYIPDDLFVVPSFSVGRIIIILVVGLVCILAVVLFLFLSACNENKTKMKKSDGTELGERRNKKESQRLVTENEDKRDSIQTNDDEMQYVENAIERLEEQKENLIHQKEKLGSLQKITETQKEKKLKWPRDGKERQKKYGYLGQIIEEHEKLLEDTDKLVDTTDKMILSMTELKGNLKGRKERGT